MTRLQQDQQFGAQGFDVITNTTKQCPVAGTEWFAVVAVTATVFEKLDAANIAINGTPGNTALAGVTIPAGTTIYGTISGIKLTSGSVLAYRKNQG